MAADWYYASNQRQNGPVSLEVLQQMIQTGALSTMDLVFGPGMSQWMPAGQVSALSPMYSPAPAPTPAVLGYGGAQMGPSGLSPFALLTLRQTGPWIRFMGVVLFIGIGLEAIGGLYMIGTALTSNYVWRTREYTIIGSIYLGMAALYLAPAIFLNRAANGIAALMRSNQMADLEKALVGQKSFWKYSGIMTIIMFVTIGLMIIYSMVQRY